MDANPASAWVDHYEGCQSTCHTLAVGLCETLPLCKPPQAESIESGGQMWYYECRTSLKTCRLLAVIELKGML